MHKVDSSGHQSNEFTNGDPALQIPRTRLEQKWLNMIQRELTRLVLQAGVALNDADDTQMTTVAMMNVATIAALRACPVPTVPAGKVCTVFVRGAAADGDGNGGFYRWLYNSASADDGASIIKPTAISSGAGRWHKVPLLAAGGSVGYATNAGHADSADTATTAGSATNAGHATNADSATNAGHATNADSATNAGHATNADSATNAGHANNADYSTTSGNAASANSANTANSANIAATANNALALGNVAADQFFPLAWYIVNQSLSGYGYKVLPGGLILQWGAVNDLILANGTSAQLSVTFSFPIAFPNEVYQVQISNELQAGDVSEIGEITSAIRSKSLSGAQSYHYRLYGAYANAGVDRFRAVWFALGR